MREKRAKEDNCLINETTYCSCVSLSKIVYYVLNRVLRRVSRKWSYASERARTRLRKFWGVKLFGKWVISRIMENAGSGRSEECTD